MKFDEVLLRKISLLILIKQLVSNKAIKFYA